MNYLFQRSLFAFVICSYYLARERHLLRRNGIFAEIKINDDEEITDSHSGSFWPQYQCGL